MAEILVNSNRSKWFRRLGSTTAAALIATVAFMGCSVTKDSDLSSTPKYKGAIGAQYRTKTELYALGLKSGADPKQIEMVWVSASPGTDSNIAFRRTIPVGHVFRVLAVRKRFVLLDNGLQFVVAANGLDLPRGIEIVIPLYGVLESTDGFPDSSRFERIPAPD